VQKQLEEFLLSHYCPPLLQSRELITGKSKPVKNKEKRCGFFFKLRSAQLPDHSTGELYWHS